MADRNSFVFKEEDNDIILQVKTLSPTKWILLDRETGQMYQGNKNGYWDRLEPIKRLDHNE